MGKETSQISEKKALSIYARMMRILKCNLMYLKKFFYENKLKLIIGEKMGIKNICSWKIKLSKKISKTDLKNYNQQLASKYIKFGEPVVRFKINDFRPYPFS